MITSNKNAKVKYVVRLQAERRFRWRERAFVVEGTRWLSELAAEGHPLKLVFCTEDWRSSDNHEAILQQVDAPVQTVSPEVMVEISDTETAPGVLSVADMVLRPFPSTPTLVLVLDGVANPGNLGTMLRTAAAAGVDGVLLGPGCVDPFNPKVLRGSMGAHLRLPIRDVAWAEMAEALVGLAVWLTDVAEGVGYTAVNWRSPSALIIGSEARGVGNEAERVAHGRCTIPMHAATESLNAAMAAGVILFEAARQRRTVSG
ncbi:MAG: RNA methyltransferase [Chloroflexi bacterium]|nr:RNA methyltransferase [Chloroflexota bacterium]MBP7591821.1 RNA methyltransferase [Chloroflexota bacterium]